MPAMFFVGANSFAKALDRSKSFANEFATGVCGSASGVASGFLRDSAASKAGAIPLQQAMSGRCVAGAIFSGQ
ncbi:hypothetical protein D9M68_633510 [compost metagenome]